MAAPIRETRGYLSRKAAVIIMFLSISVKLRRERIAERMKALQELVPNANKTDKASMLDEFIDYVKFLHLQIKILSLSRLGGAVGVAPLVADDMSSNQRKWTGTGRGLSTLRSSSLRLRTGLGSKTMRRTRTFKRAIS